MGAPRPWGAIRAPPVADEAGKSPKRCLRQNKRGDFEEVPRLAATTVAGNRGTTVGRSQWLRSKLGASAVRQRGNFVRRNRDIRNTPASHPCFADRGALSANSGRKYPKNAVKTKVLKSFRAWSMSHADAFRPANQVLKSTAVLSHRLCAAIRWPLTPARAALSYQGCPLRLPRRQRTCRTPCHAPVGATLAVARALRILLRFRRAG